MLEISEKSHTSILITSLNKIYNKVKIGKPLKSNKLYLLNIIYKLLFDNIISLNDNQKKYLINLYRNLYFYNDDQICKGPLIKKYQLKNKSKFIQAQVEDCNNYSKYNKIFYWQELDYQTDEDIIQNLINQTGYFNLKPYDTFLNFENGKNINYNNIGRICFGIMESNVLDEYNIFDSLNNNVTHTFNILFIDEINTLLFVSQNIYSHGDMTFKIKKII